MSASQEKKKRRELGSSEPLDKKNVKKTMPKALAWTVGIIGAAVAAAIVIFFAMLGTGFFEKHSTYLTVGSHKVTPVAFNYFYRETYSNIMSQYGDLASYLIDSETPLDEQTCALDDSMTWAEYLQNAAKDTIIQTYAICDAAMAEGYELNESEQLTIDSAMSNLDIYAAYSQRTSQSYLTAMYGKGSTTESYREYLELRQLAQSYYNAYAERLSYSDEEILDYYDANQADFDTVSYRSFLCSVDSGETDENGTAIVDAEASEAMAQEMASLSENNEQAFIDLAYDNASDAAKASYEDDSATLRQDQIASNVPSVLKDWLFDSARQYGDTTVVTNESGTAYAAFYVDNSGKFDVNMVDIRHILIKPVADEDAETDENGTAILTDENWADAKAKAEDILAEWEAGDKTEDSFSALATEYSQDGNAAAGGLYEDVYPGQMVTSFNDWCFDRSRKAGDTGIVETEYGYHVMYFVNSDGENYQMYRVSNAMRTADADQWVADLAAAMSSEVHSFARRFVTLKLS